MQIGNSSLEGMAMLVRAAKEEIEQYMDFVYAIVLDQTRSGYPIFTDGRKTKEDFIEHVWRSFDRADRDILLFKMDGQVEGWIQFFYIEEEHYLQTNGFNISSHTEEALSEFMDYIKENYKGYELYFGFPKCNRKAVSYLERDGWKLTDDLYNDIFLLEKYQILQENKNVVKVTRENYSDFKVLHKANEGDEMYWNVERIYENLEDWNIYLYYKKKSPVGAVYFREEEIYGIDYINGEFDKEVYYALLACVLNYGKNTGMERIVFFQDAESHDSAIEMGFLCVGEYVLYVKKV